MSSMIIGTIKSNLKQGCCLSFVLHENQTVVQKTTIGPVLASDHRGATHFGRQIDRQAWENCQVEPRANTVDEGMTS
uniref:Transposase n=1 Tax=Steinernema glaseri TaxID=37863 RepID=A0A1I7ZMY2_9BILA